MPGFFSRWDWKSSAGAARQRRDGIAAYPVGGFLAPPRIYAIINRSSAAWTMDGQNAADDWFEPVVPFGLMFVISLTTLFAFSVTIT